MEQCKKITKSFLTRPCSILFKNPVDPIADGLEGYNDIVKNPIDLSTINTKLQEKRYNSTFEWYNDMCLVFQNAIDYYPIESSISMIANFYLEVFKKEAIGLNFKSEQEWSDNVQQYTNKFTKILEKQPSLQKINPNLLSLCQRAEKNILPDKQTIANYVEKLNSLTMNDEIREDVIGILKEIEGMSIEEISGQPVDLDKLKPTSLKSLVLYANEHSL